MEKKNDEQSINHAVESKLKKGSIIKTIIIIVSVMSFVVLYGAESSGSVGSFIPQIGIFTTGAVIVAALIYHRKYGILNSSIKYLTKYNMRDLIYDVDLSQFDLPLSKISMGERAFYASKPPVIIPYSMVVWVYRHETQYIGITVEKSIVICCRDGATFQIKVNQNELSLLLNEIQKTSQDLIVGYGNEQAKQYKAIKQKFLNQNKTIQ